MKKVLALIISAVLLISAGSVSAFAATADATGDTVYKNLYAVSDGALEQTGGTAAALDSLSGAINHDETAYIAVAVYAPAAGDYTFKLGFTVENAGDTAYAAVKVGDTVKTVAYNGTDGSDEFTLTLVEGINIITCFGATDEMGDAVIKYTSVTTDSALYEIEGDFYLTGDVTGDGKVNLRDLVRFKKFLVGTAEMDEKAGELTADTTLSADDITVVRKYLLDQPEVKELIALEFDLAAVNRDNEVSDNWEF